MKSTIYTIITLSLLMMSCQSDDDITASIQEGGNVFFNLESIEVDRTSSQPVMVELRYDGPKQDLDITVPFTISFPGENNAVENEDFLLPQSDSFIIKRGQAVTSVVLLQRVLNNPEANQNRSLTFTLQSSEGVTIGNSSSNGNSITITLNSTTEIEEVDPNDPEDFIGDKKFAITVGTSTLKIPYFSGREDIRETDNNDITRAIVVLHGSGRTAKKQYTRMLAAANLETNKLDSLLIVSPQFLEEEDIDNFVLDEEHLYWSGSGWRIGFTSQDEDSNPRPERVSSYTVMDSIMVNLSKYPNLKKIVLTGHSAGGQFVNRYSATSPIADDLIADGIDISFVVNNPASYVYMNNTRKVLGTENTFAVPTINCSGYNDYRYGLDDLPSYLRDIGGEDVIRDRLKQRKVAYLIGQNDNDPNFPNFDDSCEAVLQGRDRFERAINYFDHLNDFYGTSINDLQKIEVVPGAGHSSEDMYLSEVGRRNIFRN
ncbi:hypothetical protein [uncultured Aquimarina sp.]|uniref:hypothetical protein n=1 Tax=uncultured Aquimarina sp. TaxID=575652 RepID=UPI002601BB39|nr:hypothetical protein [uncultured Aquimarina sp.]